MSPSTPVICDLRDGASRGILVVEVNMDDLLDYAPLPKEKRKHGHFEANLQTQVGKWCRECIRKPPINLRLLIDPETLSPLVRLWAGTCSSGKRGSTRAR